MSRGKRIRSAIAVTGLTAAVIGIASAGPAAASSPRLTLCPPLPAAVCGILGGGGTPTLPTGVTTAAPNSFSDSQTAQSVTLTDPLAAIYATQGVGATVKLIGSGATAGQEVDGQDITVSSSTITATFDLDAGTAPLGPGSYSINTVATSLTPLTSLLSTLGISDLPLDDAAVTVSAASPEPIAAVTVKPGGSASLSVATTGAQFAAGDALSVTASNGSAVAGITVSGTKVTGASITASLAAASSVPLGSYNLVVTDTSGQSGTCAGCVTVSDAAATKLTMTATHSHLVSGTKITLSGQLSTTAGKALGSRSVLLCLENAGTKSIKVLKTVTTSSSGAFSYAFAPKQNAVYVGYFPGDATTAASDLPAVSTVRTVTVARALTLKVTVPHAGSKSAKHPLTATGKVTPAGAGRVVKLYDGSRKLGSAKVTKKGTYRIKVKSLRAGKHSLRVKVAAQTAYTAGASKVVHKKVK